MATENSADIEKKNNRAFLIAGSLALGYIIPVLDLPPQRALDWFHVSFSCLQNFL